MQLLVRDNLRKEKLYEMAHLVSRLNPGGYAQDSPLLRGMDGVVGAQGAPGANGWNGEERKTEQGAQQGAEPGAAATGEGGGGKSESLYDEYVKWRATKPFRRLRKQSAALTGMSGFFSGKRRGAGV